MKTLPLKATTPAEKLLIRYTNCIALICIATTEKDRNELSETKQQLENELLTALESYYNN